MLTQLSKLTGMLSIFIIAALSIAAFQFEREIDNSNLDPHIKKLLTYPSYFENLLYDVRATSPYKDDFVEKRVILGAIDDQSLKEIGRFPWSRKTWAEMTAKLKHFGAKVVAYDVIFSEPERFHKGRSPDRQFADAIEDFKKGSGTIIIPYSLSSTHKADDILSFKEIPEILFDNMLETQQSGESNLHAKRVMSSTFPVGEILNASPSLAFIGIKDDKDGVFRRYPLTTNVESLNLSSLALSAYSSYTGDNPKLVIEASGDAKLELKTGTIHLNPEGEVKVNWVGDVDKFPYIGLHKIFNAALDDKEMHQLLNGNIIFIGSTAFAAHDLRHSPINAKLPGVYFHMNMVQMLLSGRFFVNQNESFMWSWLILLLGTILIVGVSHFDNAILDALAIGVFSAAVFISDSYYFIPKGYETALFFSFFPVILIYFWNTIVNFYLATKDKQFLKSAFGNYISSELIDKMYEEGHQPELGGEEEFLTAYFTDIQSFSSFSELLTPKELVLLLNEYLTVMTNILLEEHGTLDKYEGDAIIAFFGAPVKLEDHAARACRVALGMQKGQAELRKKWESEGDKWPKVVKQMMMRIGINTGPIVTGNMGCEDRMNYTMMGDSVNLAARLEESAKQYGIYSHVAYNTKIASGDQFVFRELDNIRVVGKKEPVTTYELLGIEGETPDELLEIKEKFEEGLKLYREQKWNEAISIFENAEKIERERYPGLVVKTNPSLVYIDRCKQFMETPPPADWDGVFVLTEK